MEAQTEKKNQTKAESNRERNGAKAALIDQLLAECADSGDLFGPEGVFTKLKGAVMERLLEAELREHLGKVRMSRHREQPDRGIVNGQIAGS